MNLFSKLKFSVTFLENKIQILKIILPLPSRVDDFALNAFGSVVVPCQILQNQDKHLRQILSSFSAFIQVNLHGKCTFSSAWYVCVTSYPDLCLESRVNC